MRGRGDLEVSADINVTSLVDVAFVLLIIFMITAPIMQGGVEVQLPRADTQALQPKDAMTITVDQQGRIFVDDNELTFEEFRGAFAGLVAATDPTGVYFRGDERVQYGIIVRVLAVIRSAGVTNLSIVAEPERISP